MLEIIRVGGWPMVPIVLCSIIAMTIVLERLWALRRRLIVPHELFEEIKRLHRTQALSDEQISALPSHSALGRLFAAGLRYRYISREAMQEAMQAMGRSVMAEMEQSLPMLATLASITPLLGLLGTVLGMIQVFETLADNGVGHPELLANGIGTALITTAAGLMVAIPVLVCHRYLDNRVQRLALELEQYAAQLLDLMQPIGAK
jgi:biopolymer transport protein ExbB